MKHTIIVYDRNKIVERKFETTTYEEALKIYNDFVGRGSDYVDFFTEED